MIARNLLKLLFLLPLIVEIQAYSTRYEKTELKKVKQKLDFGITSPNKKRELDSGIVSPNKKQRLEDGSSKSVGHHQSDDVHISEESHEEASESPREEDSDLSYSLDESLLDEPESSREEEDIDTDNGDEILQQRKGMLDLSPLKKGQKKSTYRNAVYAHFVGKKGDFSYIPKHEDRIDFSQLMDLEENKDDKLFYALSETEKKINNWIEEDKRFLTRSTYVGLTKNPQARIGGHQRDCSKIQDGDDIKFCEASKKVDYVSSSWNQDYDVRMSCLVYNIPKSHRPVVEVLLGEILEVKAKGTTVLGNHEAYAILKKYEFSAIRKAKLAVDEEDLGDKMATPKQRKGKFTISPIKSVKKGGLGKEIRQDSVYVHFRYEKDDRSHIPEHSERIHFRKLLGGKKKVDEAELNEAFLEIEKKVRGWIQKNSDFYDKALYVGLANNASHRAQGHKQDLAKIEDGQEISQFEPNKKVKYEASAWNQNSDIWMSILVCQIPERYMPMVEVLVGMLLDVRSKANTLLGNHDAYERVQEYYKTQERKDALKKAGLDGICERLKSKAVVSTLGQ